MVSKQLVLSLLLAAGASSASAAATPTRNLRASSNQAAAAAPAVEDVEVDGESDDDYLIIIPDVVEGRRLQDGDNATSSNSTDVVTSNNSTDIDTNTTTAANSTEIEKEEKAVVEETIRISRKCLAILQATVNDNDKLKKENYFYFTDAMSNGYFTFNNATEYSDLPMNNKFAYITLSCQCTQFGGRDNCCQGERAKIDMTGISDPTSMSTEMQRYVADVCDTTKDAIGEENMLPPTGEFPTTKQPTSSPAPTDSPVPTASPTSSWAPTDAPSTTTWPTVSAAPSDGPTTSTAPTVSSAPSVSPTVTVSPTDSPTVSSKPTVPVVVPPAEELPGNGGDDKDNLVGGLTPGAWAGIAIAGAAVLTMLIYVFTRDSGDRFRDSDSNNSNDDDVLGSSSSHVAAQKELLAITNGELREDAPGRQNSPDATNSMTASDVSSIPSTSTRGGKDVGASSSYFASNSLLPGRPDEESMLSSSEGPSFFTDESTIVEEGVEVDSPRGLAARDSLNNSNIMNTSDNSGESLDQAIESGNWEAVAASAAAIVKNNEPIDSARKPSVASIARKFDAEV